MGYSALSLPLAGHDLTITQDVPILQVRKWMEQRNGPLAPLPVLPLDQALDPEMGGLAGASVSHASNTGALLLAWPGRLMLLRGLIGVSSSSGGRGEATLRQLCSLSPVNPDFRSSRGGYSGFSEELLVWELSIK